MSDAIPESGPAGLRNPPARRPIALASTRLVVSGTGENDDETEEEDDFEDEEDEDLLDEDEDLDEDDDDEDLDEDDDDEDLDEEEEED
ncbi:hypothetical protein ACFQS7_14325 [Dankookia sp. GCM10030260]|uniref:hypothetical protein n=1 Tax=Dankookia sp. GCM10030260 TaxID=3273390 RepID=UPI003617D996